MNRLNERCLKIVYTGKHSSLKEDGSVSIHEKNIPIQAMEVYKISQNLSPLLCIQFQE